METNPDQSTIPQWLLDEIKSFLAEKSKRERRAETSYANNVVFAANIWDLKIMFGSLIHRSGQGDIDWHTTVTIPWTQAKLMDYYLRVNLAFREKENGPVEVPRSMVPALPPPEDNETSRAQFDLVNQIHREVFGIQAGPSGKVGEE